VSGAGAAGEWEPPPPVAALLYTDADGQGGDPDAVIATAREDGRWRALVGPVQDAMHDGDLHPLWRWLACRALVRWADPAGYDAVMSACAAPDRVVWRGVATDRFTDADTTFAELAEDVGDSHDFAPQREAAGLRLETLRALLGVADRVDLVHSLGQGIVLALEEDDVVTLAPELAAAVGACRRALDASSGGLDVAAQMAGLLGRLVEVDEPAAVEQARWLLAERPSRDVLVWLGALFAGGRGEESLLLADEIASAATRGGLDVPMEDTLAARRRWVERRAGSDPAR